MGKYDDARAVREFEKNPPKYAPGQGDSESDDFFSQAFNENSSNNIGNSDPFLGSDNMDVNDVLNQANNASNTNNNNANTNDPNQALKNFTSDEDKMIEGIKVAFGILSKVFKALWKFLTQILNTWGNNTSRDWHIYGTMICKIASVVFIIGLFFVILSPFVPSINDPSYAMIGSLLAEIVGITLIFKFPYGDRSDEVEIKQEREPIENVQSPDSESDVFSNLFDNDDMADEEDFEDEENVSMFEDEEDEDDSYDWDSLLQQVEKEEAASALRAGSENFDLDTAVDNVKDIPQGTYTRQYLFETMSAVLPVIHPDFYVKQEVDEESDEFMMFDEYLRNAAIQAGTKDEKIPFLQEVRKNLFIIQLRASRPAGLKEKEIADNVADQYRRRGDEIDRKVYATVDSEVGTLVINLFIGKDVMVSLGDVYGHIKDFMLNTKNRFPYVWGVSELGNPWYCDMYDCESVIVCGEARGGKSWKGQSIVAQLCMFNSPKEVEFYIFDHKNLSSDYRYLSTQLPHVKYFCGDRALINDGIERVINYTIKENQSRMAQEGYINIKDYNKNHPTEKLPFRYVLVDEMQSLMDNYDKDQQQKFRNLLSTIVSELPFLGLRVILFPHRIVDYIISKNTYSLISSRAVVRQLNEEEIKNAVNVSKSQFPYNLVNYGDMAIKTKDIANGNVVFCHAEVLTPSNDGNKQLFQYIGAIWRKLEPDCECLELGTKSSVGGHIGSYRVYQKLEKDPVDNPVGKETYEYKPTEGTSIEGISVEKEQKLDKDDEDEMLDDFWTNFKSNL